MLRALPSSFSLLLRVFDFFVFYYTRTPAPNQRGAQQITSGLIPKKYGNQTACISVLFCAHPNNIRHVLPVFLH
ncbi:MAG: hypothetical protein ACLSIR_12780, partial [Christensenellales bacterium]